jgi:hypothetical protein
MLIQLSGALRTTQTGDFGAALGAGFTIELRTGDPPPP